MSTESPAEHMPIAPYLAAMCGVAWWQGAIGVLAKGIAIPAVPLVFGRCFVAAIALGLIARLGRRSYVDSPRALFGAVVAGLLLAAHWVTLFHAYKIADVALVVTGVFTFPVMVALAEPWCFGYRPGLRQIGAACLVVAGIAIMRPVGPDAAQQLTGLMWAVISAACFAARNILSRRLLTRAGKPSGDAIPLMAWQTAVVAVVLSPWLIDASLLQVGWGSVAMTVVLGLFFTALPHTIGTHIMARLSAATVGIVGSQQVISGIILAWLIRDETVTWPVVAGASLVLLAVCLESAAKWREGKTRALEAVAAEAGAKN
ncbi:MAG: DMT family transporter [Planctomycetota bacterium]|nr:DMT family transporter [Planctomycetota bacterium]